MLRAAWARLMRHTGRRERVAMAVLLAVFVVGILGAPLVEGGPTTLSGVSLQAPLGRDHLGRNVLIRLIGGAGAVAIPFAWAALIGGLGAAAAAWSSWTGGVVRGAFGGLVGVIAAIPSFVWVLLALSVYGRSQAVLGVAAGIAFLPGVVAVLDARIAPWRQDPTILAELAHGVPPRVVLWERLVFWECGPALVRQTLGLFGFVAALEATLAYLGFTVGEPLPSWGNAVVFDWGRTDLALVARLAPAATLWLTCWLATVAAGDRA
ncbi:MAG: hypothetical protein R3F61_15920 [Myxococcota bacterium]